MIRFKDVTKVVLVLALCFGFAGVGNAVGNERDEKKLLVERYQFLQYAENMYGHDYADYNYKCSTYEKKQTDKCKKLKEQMEMWRRSLLDAKNEFEWQKEKIGEALCRV
ncbi:MAG: hypothetical protein LE178_06405 [Endomicrobium sp.]|nr:hypothetical protein [Endomicrobium sp.]